MSTKTTYKQTELGLIPEDWEVKKFNKFSKFYSGGTPLTSKSEYYGGEIPFIKSGEIYYDRTEQFLTQEGLNNSSAKLVYRGDLLYALYGANSGEVAISQLEGAINQAILCIQQNKDEAETIYLYNYLKLEKSNIINKFLQGGQGNLSADIIKNLQIPLPPLPEQKKIADCLSTWDVAIEKQSALINALTERKKALMQQLLTGKKRLPGFSGEWKEVKLGSICENFQNGNAFSAKDYKKTGIPIVTMGNINLGGYFYFSESKSNFWIEDKSLERYEIKKGDLIIAMTDVTPEKNLIGLTSIIDIDRIFYLNQRVGHIILKPKLADTDFIFYLSQNSYWRNQCKAFATLGVQANLGTNDIKNINIKLPSLSEQTAIAEILATADRELQLQKEKLAQLQTQKKGLMQVLLTGKKRLIN